MSEQPNLTGKLLLAYPHLRDPHFRRSIVYLARHDPATGAFGFIINRPTSQTLEALTLPEIPPNLANIPIYLGGPVSGDSVIFVNLSWDPFLKKMAIDYATSPEDAEPLHTIAILGYAGWGEGQLEGEIDQHSWLILDPAETDGLLREADAATWKTLVSRIHPHLHLLAEMPDDPSLN